MTRRLLLGTGVLVVAGAAAGVGAQLTGRLDDLAEAVGIDPKPRSDAGDDQLVRSTARALGVLLASVEATAAAHRDVPLADLEVIGRQHLDAVGGTAGATDTTAVPADRAAAVTALRRAYTAAATARADDAQRAVSPDLARVLASMSAGLAQCSRVVGRLA